MKNKKILRASMRCLALGSLAAGLGLGGCKDATRPEVAVEVPAPPEVVASVRAVLGDATERLLPALPDITERAKLQRYVALVSDQLTAGKVFHARQFLLLAQNSLKRLSGDAELAGSAPDLAAIGLALDFTERALQSGARSERAQSGKQSDRDKTSRAK